MSARFLIAAVSAPLLLASCDHVGGAHPSACDVRASTGGAIESYNRWRLREAPDIPRLERIVGVSEVTGVKASRRYCSGVGVFADGARAGLYWSFFRESGFPVSGPGLRLCTGDLTACTAHRPEPSPGG